MGECKQAIITSKDFEEMVKRAVKELKPFFQPKSIAVIGASHDVNSPGWVVFKQLLEYHRKGLLKAKVYGVNIKGGELFGEKLYKKITDIPDDIDLAVIIIPAKFVPQVMEDCGGKRVKCVIIISAGFSEIGNTELEEKVKKVAEKYNIRVMGPNCLGVYDAISYVDTLFVPQFKQLKGKNVLSLPRPKLGPILFYSQSGALGAAVLDYMYGEEIGISKFVSVGNKMDVDEVDTLLWAKEDPHIRVVMMYIEGLKADRARLFVEVAKEFVKHKPLVILKGGKGGAAAARAVMSHTASMAGAWRVYEAAFKQIGAIIADDLLKMLDAAKALAFQPPAAGKKIAIVTNGGGAGVLATDAAETMGLEVPAPSEKVLNEFRKAQEEKLIVEFATFSNPFDLTGSATDDSYLAAIDIVMKSPEFDAILIIGLHHVPTLSEEFVDKICKLIRKYKKPVVAVDIGGADYARYVRARFDDYGIPAFPTPERGIYALWTLVKYGQTLKKLGVFDKYIKKWKHIEIRQ